MSLIDLNPVDNSSSTTLPRYDGNIFSSPSNELLSNFAFASDVDETNTYWALSAPSYYRNSIVHNTSLTFTPATITNYVYIFQNVDSNWTLIQTITNPGSDTDNFGFSLSFSKTDGTYLAVGTFNRSNSVALAYVYKSDLNTTPQWGLAYDTSSTFNVASHASISNASNLGFRVLLDNDGDHLVLMGTSGIINQFSRSGIVWSQDVGDTVSATGGSSTEALLLGLDGNSDHSVLIRGSPFYPAGESDKSLQTGIVEIIENGVIGQVFTGGVGDRIGASTTISNNGLYIAYSSLKLSADLDLRVIDTGGIVYIYVKSGGGFFTLQETITGLTVNATTGSFGSDLALNITGNILIIGDAYANTYAGSTYLFTRNDDIWSQTFSLDSNTADSEVQQLTTENNTLNIVETSPPKTIDIIFTVGTYNGTTLATELATQLNSQGNQTYTVSYNNNAEFVITATTGAIGLNLDISSIANILGFPSVGTLVTAGSQTSSQLPTFSFNGAEFGRNVNISDALGTYVTSGYSGHIGPAPENYNGVGKAAIFLSTNILSLFNNEFIIDTTNTKSFLVRRNNDTQDVFRVDTTEGVSSEGAVISEGVLCANNTLEAVSSTSAGFKAAGGVGVAKNLIVDGTSTLINSVTTSNNVLQNFTVTPTFKNGIEGVLDEGLPGTIFNSFIDGDYLYITAYNLNVTGSTFTITGATKANPCVVTTSSPHGFSNFDEVVIVNNTLRSPDINKVHDGSNYVTNVDVNTFELRETDTSSSIGDGSGGTVQKISFPSTFSESLLIYHIGDENVAPSLLGSVTDNDLHFAGRIAKAGKYLFGIANDFPNGYLVTFDISDPTTPTIVNKYATEVGANLASLTLSGNYVFIGGSVGTDIVNISDPLNPFTISTVAHGNAVTFSRNYLYIFNVDLYVYDCNDLTTPSLVYTYSLGSTDITGGHDVTIVGNYMYGVTSGLLYVWDISDPELPILKDSLQYGRPGNDKSLRVYDNSLVIVRNVEGLINFIDASDPSNLTIPVTLNIPHILGLGNAGHIAPQFELIGKYLYLFHNDVNDAALMVKRYEIQSSSILSLLCTNAKIGTLDVMGNTKINGKLYVDSIQNIGMGYHEKGIGTSGAITMGTISTTNNPLLTTTYCRTGSFAMANNTGPGDLGTGTDLLFSGQKMFILESYVEVSAGTDLWSNYRLTGVNESLTSDSWSLTVTRNGVTDPGITFSITAAGQVQYTTPAFAATFVHCHIYYEIVSNIM